jgi:hypothetical protein
VGRSLPAVRLAKQSLLAKFLVATVRPCNRRLLSATGCCPTLQSTGHAPAGRVMPFISNVRRRMSNLPPKVDENLLALEQEFEARRRGIIPMPFLVVAVVVSIASLLLASLPLFSPAASGALRGVAFICFGFVGSVFLAYTWWHRQPIKIKGGLSPDRPFFYHLGAAFFFGTSCLLVVVGVAFIARWAKA